MEYLVNAREMKQCDNNTIAHFGIPSFVLMERAALSVVDIICKLEQYTTKKVLVLCGTGNNGADGMAVARLLFLKKMDVQVYFAGNRKKFSQEAKKQYDILEQYQVPFTETLTDSYDIIVDAVFGIGLSRKLEDATQQLLEQINSFRGFKIAVDIPSGIAADTGNIMGNAFRADVTVTFAYRKMGMLLYPGAAYCGDICVADIGIDKHSWLDKKPSLYALTQQDVLPYLSRNADGNKGTFGKVLLIAGSVNMAGAAILAAGAAYTTGCGLVRIFTPEENRIILQTAVPEAILTTYQGKRVDMTLLNECLAWADVIVIGPGLGTDDTAKGIVKNTLKNAAVPMVVDADALNIIAAQVEQLLKPHTELILTPHLGEMARLNQMAVSYIKENIVQVAEEFAREYNVICVLKDSRTITAVPYGKTYLNTSGNSGMATAGSGDVLTGIIGSLIAQGIHAEQAAPLGVYLHGAAADASVNKVGEHALRASTIIAGLPEVYK